MDDRFNKIIIKYTFSGILRLTLISDIGKRKIIVFNIFAWFHISLTFCESNFLPPRLKNHISVSVSYYRLVDVHAFKHISITPYLRCLKINALCEYDIPYRNWIYEILQKLEFYVELGKSNNKYKNQISYIWKLFLKKSLIH